MTRYRCPIQQRASTDPDNLAIRGAECLTYAELDHRITQLSCHYAAQLPPQSGIVFQEPPSISFITQYFACLRAGIIPILLSTRLPLEETRQILSKYQLKHYTGIYDEAFLDKICHPPKPSAHHTQKDPTHPIIPKHQIASIMMTSGSSGPPKLAVHSILNHMSSAEGLIAHLGLDATSNWLLSLPIYHVGGLGILFRCFMSGGSVTLPQSKHLAEELRRENITHVSLVSTQLKQLLDGSHRFPNLSCALLGGMHLPEALAKKALSAGYPLCYSYGLTEMSATVTCSDLPSKIPIDCGAPLQGRQIKCAPDGEILVKGSSLFKGYLFHHPHHRASDSPIFGASLRLPLDQESWFRTGDLGRINAKGKLTITGRKDRQFISGGENIQPEEIESLLMTHPQITHARVQGIPDEDYGHRPEAILSINAPLSADEITAFIRPKLPKYKWPVSYRFHKESSHITQKLEGVF